MTQKVDLPFAFERNYMEIILLALLNILCPPAAVAIHRGLNEDFVINLVLTILGYFPGLIHGFYVLLRD